MVCDFKIPCHVLSRRHHRGSSPFSGARTHSDNTSEMIVMIEALSFVGSHGPVARCEQPVFFFRFAACCWFLFGHDPGSYTCAVGTRLSTVHDFSINANFCPPRKTRERSQSKSGQCMCSDHAAALGTFGLATNQNVATRWIHQNFDASACFDGCHNIAEVLERLQRIRTDAASLPK